MRTPEEITRFAAHGVTFGETVMDDSPPPAPPSPPPSPAPKPPPKDEEPIG